MSNLASHNDDRAQHSSVSSPTDRSPLSFNRVMEHFPPEVTVQLLRAWMAPQRLCVVPYTNTIYKVDWTCETDRAPFSPAIIPSWLRQEYNNIRKHSWHRDCKIFEDPFHFYLSHLFLRPAPCIRSLEPWTSFIQQGLQMWISPYIWRPHPRLTHHGLEKIWLDFTAEQLFAFFDVRVSPYDDWAGNNLYEDEFCHGAALFLQNTEELTLEFGDRYKSEHAWYSLDDEFWTEDREEWLHGAACFRPNVCDSGLVIDWMLSYAWQNQYLQHIQKVRLVGDVQEWVKEKWHRMFEQQTQYNRVCTANNTIPDPFQLFKPDLYGIKHHGMIVGEEDNYDPESFYPPTCECNTKCRRLFRGRVVDEPRDRTWDEVEAEQGVSAASPSEGDWTLEGSF